MAQTGMNVLLILTDQQRPDTIGAYRGPESPGPSTPHLDRLAGEGAIFENAYCSQPVCSPARGSILTGLYPHNHGVVDNRTALPAAHRTLAEYLVPSAYRCGYIGKWHLGRELTAQHGFDEWRSTEDYGHGYADDGSAATTTSSYHQWLVSRGVVSQSSDPISRADAARLPEEHGKPAFIAEESARFIASNAGHPFLLTCSFLEPHPPNFGPLDDLYDPEDIRLPTSWDAPLDLSAPARFRDRLIAAPPGAWSLSYKDGPVDDPVPGGDERKWKETIARYWGLCTLVDGHVGRILAALDQHRVRDRTIVVFTSDHGDMMGEHSFLGKNLPYEGATRVPLIVSVPGLESRRIGSPISQVDLVPTLLDLVGEPVPGQIDGVSRASMVAHGDRGLTTSVVVEWTGFEGFPKAIRDEAGIESSKSPGARTLKVDWRSLRQGSWKLCVHESGEHELYELRSDPWEATNLYADPDCASVVGDLWAALAEWQARTHDQFVLLPR